MGMNGIDSNCGKCFRWMALAAFLAWTLSLCAAHRRYPVHGLVLSVDKAHHSMVASIQAIPGYMDAMVMPFDVRDGKELKNLSRGAMIDFTLVVGKDDAYAEDIRLHEFRSMEVDPMAAQRLHLLDAMTDPSLSSANDLKVGDQVPDFSLIDQTKQSISLSQFSGKVVAITFIYTRCPLPNYCFRMSNNFGRLQKRFSGQMGRNLVLLSISFDPVHDQPEVLAKYGLTWQANAQGWHLLTGNPSDIQEICNRFGMSFYPDEGVMIHSLHTVVIDRKGKLVANLEGNEFTADQLGDLVQAVLKRK
jgi:protein SCO1